jgi:hypothetical protein
VRWVVIAIVVLLVGVLSYNFLARERTGAAPAAPPSTPAPHNAGVPSK